MNDLEFVNDYFARTLANTNKMSDHGERFEQAAVVENVLQRNTKVERNGGNLNILHDEKTT